MALEIFSMFLKFIDKTSKEGIHQELLMENST